VLVAGLALVLVLSGCTGTGEPMGTPDPVGEEQAPVAGSTGPSPLGATGGEVPADVELEPGLYLVDPETGEAEPLLGAAGEAREPELSPDGSALVYQSTGARGIPQIFVLQDGRARRLTRLQGGAAEPTWAPDGSQIAFAGVMTEGEDSDIFVMDADGGDVRLLARTHVYDRRPDWSPDGSRIVFDTYGEIWVASVDDGQVARIRANTNRAANAAAPIWSPNGRRIALTSYDGHPINGIVHITRLWVVRPDGTGLRPLDDQKPEFFDWQLEASWSPDGHAIVFLSSENGGDLLQEPMDMGMIDVQTGEVTYLPVSFRAQDLSPFHAWDLSWDAAGILIASVREDTPPSPPIRGIVSLRRWSLDPWPAAA